MIVAVTDRGQLIGRTILRRRSEHLCPDSQDCDLWSDRYQSRKWSLKILWNKSIMCFIQRTHFVISDYVTIHKNQVHTFKIHLRLGLRNVPFLTFQVFRLKFWVNFLSVPCVLHFLPIVSSWVDHPNNFSWKEQFMWLLTGRQWKNQLTPILNFFCLLLFPVDTIIGWQVGARTIWTRWNYRALNRNKTPITCDFAVRNSQFIDSPEKLTKGDLICSCTVLR
jgi:hypothetical protein